MSDVMNAVEITKAGGPEVLQMTQRPMPVAGPDQVVIRVAFAGVNRPDALQRAGMYAPPQPPAICPDLRHRAKLLR